MRCANGPRSTFVVKPLKATTAPAGKKEQARKQLSLGKLYLRSKMNDEAAAIFRGILEAYPSTKAAAEARRLLGGAVTRPSK